MSWADDADLEVAHEDRRPVVVVELRHLGDVVERLAVLRVVPGPDHVVALERRVRAGVRLGRDARHVAVGDLDAVAGLAVELPPVERAADAVVLDPAADGEVGTEVGTVGVHAHGACRRPPGRARGRGRSSGSARTSPGPRSAASATTNQPFGHRERVAIGPRTSTCRYRRLQVGEQIRGRGASASPAGRPPLSTLGGVAASSPERDVVGRVGHRLSPRQPEVFRAENNKSPQQGPSGPGPERYRACHGRRGARPGRVPRPRVGRPPRISRQMIAEAANEIGLEGLTLRAVADHLDVTHRGAVPPRLGQGRPDARGGRVLGRPRCRSRRTRGQHWAVWLHEWAAYNHDIFLAQPGAPRPVPRRGHPDGDHRGNVDRILGGLVREGFTVLEANSAYEVVSACALGSALVAAREARAPRVRTLSAGGARGRARRSA